MCLGPIDSDKRDNCSFVYHACLICSPMGTPLKLLMGPKTSKIKSSKRKTNTFNEAKNPNCTGNGWESRMATR